MELRILTNALIRMLDDRAAAAVGQVEEGEVARASILLELEVELDSEGEPVINFELDCSSTDAGFFPAYAHGSQRRRAN